MLKSFHFYVEFISNIVEAIGILIIFIGTVRAICLYLLNYKKEGTTYVQLRQSLGKSILLGLEVLIAADIMATVVAVPTLKSVSILALIVLVRTFMSLSLQVELEGRFPWQKKID